MTADPRVVAVVVTWNRAGLLVEALEAVAGQTRAADVVVVVDNASTDGSAAIVRKRFPSVDLVETGSNIGGAGGFAVGLTRALALHADVVWLLDDDTVATPTALAELLRARTDYPGPSPTLVASKVVWTDGRDHPMNTPRRKPVVLRRERAAAAAVGCSPVRSASFVSVLLDADQVRSRGLPVADYFLWNDDFEFTTRLLRRRRGLHCPASVVIHKTGTFGATDADPGERFFYEVRNKVWLFTRSPGLGAVDRILYAGSSLRRWAHTVSGSHDRRTLLRALWRGLAAGVRRGPRRTEDVLVSAGIDPATGTRR